MSGGNVMPAVHGTGITHRVTRLWKRLALRK